MKCNTYNYVLISIYPTLAMLFCFQHWQKKKKKKKNETLLNLHFSWREAIHNVCSDKILMLEIEIVYMIEQTYYQPNIWFGREQVL